MTLLPEREIAYQYFIPPTPLPPMLIQKGEARDVRWMIKGGRRGGKGWWRAQRPDKGAVVISRTGRPSGVRGASVGVRPAVMKIFHYRYCWQTLSESESGGRQESKWNISIQPCSSTSQREQGRERRSLCVRPDTESLHSAHPLSLSPLILNEPISTGKPIRSGSAGSPHTGVGTKQRFYIHLQSRGG